MFGTTQGDLPDRQDPQADAHWAARTLPSVLAFGLAIKLVAILLLGHLSPDADTLKAWCMALARQGPHGFFTGQDLPNIQPGSLHPLGALLLWPLGVIWRMWDPTFVHHAGRMFALWVRLPALLAEVAAAGALYLLAERFTGPRRALPTAAALFLNPALILGSTVWGHTEALIVAFVLWGVLEIVRSRYTLGVALVGAAGLVHVHAFAFLPVAVVVASRRGGAGKALGGAGAVLLGAMLLGQLLAPSAWSSVYTAQPAAEPYTTYNAFNAWYPLGNLEHGDQPLLPKLPLPTSRHALGLFATFGLVLIAMFKAATRENDSDFLREMMLLALGL